MSRRLYFLPDIDINPVSEYNYYGDTMTSFVLKIIAIIAMTFDHLGATFFPLGDVYLPYNIILRVAGRLTMPMMAFFIAEGYRKTKNPAKYLIRLSVFAVISELPFELLFGEGTNVMFTIALGLAGLWASDIIVKRTSVKYLRFVVYIITIAVSILIHSDWNYIGLLLIYAFYYADKSISKRILLPFLVYCLEMLVAFIEAASGGGFEYFYVNYIQFAGVFAIPLLLLYNGKRGAKMKYLFYIYYPLHITIFWLINTYALR